MLLHMPMQPDANNRRLVGVMCSSLCWRCFSFSCAQQSQQSHSVNNVFSRSTSVTHFFHKCKKKTKKTLPLLYLMLNHHGWILSCLVAAGFASLFLFTPEADGMKWSSEKCEWFRLQAASHRCWCEHSAPITQHNTRNNLSRPLLLNDRKLNYPAYD